MDTLLGTGKGNDPNCGSALPMLAADAGLAPEAAFTPTAALRERGRGFQQSVLSEDAEAMLARMDESLQLELSRRPQTPGLLDRLRRPREARAQPQLEQACAPLGEETPYSIKVAEIGQGYVQLDLLRDGKATRTMSKPESEYLQLIEQGKQWDQLAQRWNLEQRRAKQALRSIPALNDTLKVRHEAALKPLPGQPGFDYPRYRVKISDGRNASTRGLFFVSMYQTRDQYFGRYEYEASEHGPWGDEVTQANATFDDLAYSAARWEAEANRRTAQAAADWYASDLAEQWKADQLKTQEHMAKGTAETVLAAIEQAR